jgi:hypothetical protein
MDVIRKQIEMEYDLFQLCMFDWYENNIMWIGVHLSHFTSH